MSEEIYEVEDVEPVIEEVRVRDVSNSFKEVDIRFRENRSFELHIGRKMYRFEGRETKRLPISVLEHPDWTDQISKLFSVREVE